MLRTSQMFRQIIISCLTLQMVSCATPTPATFWSPPQVDSETTVTLAQVGLRAYGYSPGPVDGLEGEATRRAMRAFRAARGLPSGDRVDASLLASLYRDPDFSRPFPYAEGNLLMCFRWGINNVLMYASSIGTLTCTVKGPQTASTQVVQSGLNFCQRSIMMLREFAQCDLIFDGNKFTKIERLNWIIHNPSPDSPALVEFFDSRTGTTSKIQGILRSEPLLFNFLDASINNRPPQPVDRSFAVELLTARGARFCRGHGSHSSQIALDLRVRCFEATYEMLGEARLAGFMRTGGAVIPVYEGEVRHSRSWARFTPPADFVPF